MTSDFNLVLPVRPFNNCVIIKNQFLYYRLA
jgi:hypothetical protein